MRLKKYSLIMLYALVPLALALLIWVGVASGTGFSTKTVWDWLQ